MRSRALMTHYISNRSEGNWIEGRGAMEVTILQLEPEKTLGGLLGLVVLDKILQGLGLGGSLVEALLDFLFQLSTFGPTISN